MYIKRLGTFPFKVQLFQGCKRETEPINTKSVVKHVIRYQVLLATYYKADTKYCWRHITRPIPSIVAVVQHVCQVTLSTSPHTHQPFVYDIKYCWWHITKPIPSIVAVVQHVCQVTLSTSLHTHQPFVYDTKYCCCRATCLSGHIVDFTAHISTVCIRYQVLLLSCNMFVKSHCRLHYTHINRLYTIPSIVGGTRFSCFRC
jgi:hypothetical protein